MYRALGCRARKTVRSLPLEGSQLSALSSSKTRRPRVRSLPLEGSQPVLKQLGAIFVDIGFAHYPWRDRNRPTAHAPAAADAMGEVQVAGPFMSEDEAKAAIASQEGCKDTDQPAGGSMDSSGGSMGSGGTGSGSGGTGGGTN